MCDTIFDEICGRAYLAVGLGAATRAAAGAGVGKVDVDKDNTASLEFSEKAAVC
jgi:hypothetical protein